METVMQNGAGFWALSAFTNDNVRFCAVRAPEREYLTQTALAQYVGRSVMWVWRAEHGYTAKSGKIIPPLEGFPKRNPHGLWKRSQIDDFMAGGAEEAA